MDGDWVLKSKGKKMRFSKTTQSFYPENLIYKDLPQDLIDVDDQCFLEIIDSRKSGDRIEIVDGKLKIIAPPKPTKEQKRKDEIAEIQLLAKSKLVETDWTQLPDVSENLINSKEFLAYRKKLRKLITNISDETMSDFPEKPKAKWGDGK
jgi:hypothetical protein